MSLAYRQKADQAMHQLSAEEPEWFGLWVSGVLADLLETLDPEDPWRNTAGVDDTVVLPDGSPFGTWQNATDILPLPAGGDPSLDVALAPLIEPLSASSARFWCAAQAGREHALDTLCNIEVGGPYPVTIPALEWAMFRRRIFMGQEDAYIPHLCVEWVRRADKIAAGQPWDESGAARLRVGSSVEPGTWRLLS